MLGHKTAIPPALLIYSRHVPLPFCISLGLWRPYSRIQNGGNLEMEWDAKPQLQPAGLSTHPQRSHN
jgi:hypothetical protein